MQYINGVYSNGKYKIEVNHQNIVGNIDDKMLTSFYYDILNNSNPWIVALLFVVSFAFILFAFFIIWKNNFSKSFIFIGATVLLCLAPYVIFKISSDLSYSVSFFTFFSCRTFFIMLLLISCLLLLMKLFKRPKLTKYFSGDDYYEINI